MSIRQRLEALEASLPREIVLTLDDGSQFRHPGPALEFVCSGMAEAAEGGGPIADACCGDGMVSSYLQSERRQFILLDVEDYVDGRVQLPFLPYQERNPLAEDQAPSDPRLLPLTGTGVYGIGDRVGVEGDNDTTDDNGKNVGTGVLGQSVQGIGVVGNAFGDITAKKPIYPYIGVYGSGQTNGTAPYPINSTYLATGVFGIGDLRGGVFQTTPHLNAAQETFANVQLTPLKLPQQGKVGSFTPTHIPPRLPTKGNPGDILAVNVQLGTSNDPNGMQLWVCIKEPGGGLGTTWARIGFDAIVVTR